MFDFLQIQKKESLISLKSSKINTFTFTKDAVNWNKIKQVNPGSLISACLWNMSIIQNVPDQDVRSLKNVNPP